MISEDLRSSLKRLQKHLQRVWTRTLQSDRLYTLGVRRVIARKVQKVLECIGVHCAAEKIKQLLSKKNIVTRSQRQAADC